MGTSATYRRALAPGFAFVIAAGAAWAAKPPPPATAPAVQNVLNCRSITDDTQRLACFDKSVAAMANAQKTGDLLAIDKAQRRAARHQVFGLPLTTLGFLDSGEKPEEINRITAKVKSASQIAGGKWVIKLDDGAVWRQIDDQELPDGAHPGSTVVISRGTMGSFFVKVDGQQAIKMHRDS
jgi:hypothetical protein